MGNISTRFTFRDGKTYLTGFPKWTGIHDLNDPVYSGYDTLYIGPPTADQNRYYIIGPSRTSVNSPKLGIESVDPLSPDIISPGLHDIEFDDDGYSLDTVTSDIPNVLPTLEEFRTELYANQDGQTAKIIPVRNNWTISFSFSNMQYQADNNFLPKYGISTEIDSWPCTLLLPLGSFTAPTGATENGYSIYANYQEEGAFVYIDGKEKTGEQFKHFFTVPVLLEYGPRRHFQSTLGAGQHWYDTCYHFRSVNLTNTAIQPGGPT